MSCIAHHWSQEGQKRVYSCPECKNTFRPRPALAKNIMLADEIEKQKKTDHQAEDVECDSCDGRKHKAVKSCLVCLSSFCQDHLEQHDHLFKGKGHNLIDATRQLKDIICKKHNRPLDIYCRTDHRCICMSCMVDEHRRHKTVSVATERTVKQTTRLGNAQDKYQQRIQEQEKKLQELKEVVEAHKRSAQVAVENSERILPELIRFIQSRYDEITPMIRARERIVVSHAEGLMKQLEQHTDDLKKGSSELEQLSHTRDDTYFLQHFQPLCVLPQLPNIPSTSDGLFNDVGNSVSELKQKLEDLCRKEFEKLSGQVTCIQIIPTPEYESRTDFLNYFKQFTLDPNTAHECLHLSEENRMVTYTSKPQVPAHSDRFSYWWQVLCNESVDGRCYWEVEWSLSGKASVSIAVSYKSISRKGWGYECKFGGNDQSWSLVCSPSKYIFLHNNNETSLPVVRSSSRIGVYVDASAGILSFYSVSDKMSLIHRIQTTFTHPLYPGFNIHFWKVTQLAKYPLLKLCDKRI